MRKTQNLLTNLASFVPKDQLVNTKISSANINWHIQHSLLVIKQITKYVTSSDPAQYQHKFNFKRFIIFLIGRFPRGKASAPASVMPITPISPAQYPEMFESANLALAALAKAKPNQYFVHPIFGKLNVKDTFTMLTIHTDHHIKIIQDIIKG